MSLPSARPRGAVLVLTILASLYVLACLPILWLGYGADHDAWLVARCALDLASGKGYAPSRMPGYPLYEFLQAALIPWGGPLASNLASLLATAGCAALFWRILALRGEPARLSALAFFGLHPSILKNALTTMDYNFALLFVLAAYLAFLKRGHLAAGLALGLACGFRLTSAFFLLPLVWMLAGERRGWRAFFALCLPAAAAGAAAFLPLLLKYGLGFLFFRMEDHVGFGRRALSGGYNALSYCGPLATPAILAALAWALKRRLQALSQALADAPFVTMAVYGALFLVLPHETDYLVVITPFLALFLWRAVGTRWRRAIVALTILHGIATVDLVGGESAQRFFQPRLVLGVLPTDAYLRLRYLRLRERLPAAAVPDKPTVVLTGAPTFEVDNPNLTAGRVQARRMELDLSRFKGTNVYIACALAPEQIEALRAEAWRIGYLNIARGNLIGSFALDPVAEGCFEINANALSGLPNLPIKKR